MRDISIVGNSGMYIVAAFTRQGEDWLAENVMGQIDGIAFRENFGSANGIAFDAVAAGLNVSFDGSPVTLRPQRVERMAN